jgi:hypothetical protein
MTARSRAVNPVLTHSNQYKSVDDSRPTRFARESQPVGSDIKTSNVATEIKTCLIFVRSDVQDIEAEFSTMKSSLTTPPTESPARYECVLKSILLFAVDFVFVNVCFAEAGRKYQ